MTGSPEEAATSSASADAECDCAVLLNVLSKR